MHRARLRNVSSSLSHERRSVAAFAAMRCRSEGPLSVTKTKSGGEGPNRRAAGARGDPPSRFFRAKNTYGEAWYATCSERHARPATVHQGDSFMRPMTAMIVMCGLTLFACSKNDETSTLTT